MPPALPFPTDNLYKFVAILGVVVFAVCIYGAVALDGESADARVRADRLAVVAMEFLNGEPRQSASQPTTDPSTQPTRLGSTQPNDDLHYRLSKVGEKSSPAIEALFFTAFLSLCSSAGGMIFWFMKHQRYLDRTVKLEAALADAELSKLQGELANNWAEVAKTKAADKAARKAAAQELRNAKRRKA